MTEDSDRLRREYLGEDHRATDREPGDFSGHTTFPIEDQPPPVHTKGMAIVDLVIHDMYERKAVGIARYGVPLQAHNGRSMLIDLYQELMDAVMYVRGEIEERNSVLPEQPLKISKAISQAHKYLHSDDHPVQLCGEAPCYWLIEAVE